MNIIVTSNSKRPQLLQQTLESLDENSTLEHTITLVLDKHFGLVLPIYSVVATITLHNSVGASACRNVGASSIPKYSRSEYVLFSDDDCFYTAGWDHKLVNVLKANGEIGRAHV